MIVGLALFRRYPRLASLLLLASLLVLMRWAVTPGHQVEGCHAPSVEPAAAP